MEISSQQLVINFENIHVLAKITPVISPAFILEEYLLCEEVLCPWEEINNLTGCYCCSKSGFYDFFIQDTNSDFILVNYSPINKRKECLAEFGSHASLPFNICWDSCEIKKLNNFRCLKFKVRNTLFSCMILELYRSKSYRQKLLFNLYSYYNQRYKSNMLLQNSICHNCKNRIWKIKVWVLLKNHQQDSLDIAWDNKIQRLILEKCELENAMAWLSTLGGAFSALGDVFVHCAEKAGAISVQQLQIALRLGDPLTICRCQIYVAMSLLQRGYYKKTKQMIRQLYAFSTQGEGKRDFRLKNMCVAVWNRLKYVSSFAKHSNK